MSISTAENTLKKYGLHGRVARKKPFISVKNQKLRLEFAKNHINWTIQDCLKYFGLINQSLVNLDPKAKCMSVVANMKN